MTDREQCAWSTAHVEPGRVVAGVLQAPPLGLGTIIADLLGDPLVVAMRAFEFPTLPSILGDLVRAYDPLQLVLASMPSPFAAAAAQFAVQFEPPSIIAQVHREHDSTCW